MTALMSVRVCCFFRNLRPGVFLPLQGEVKFQTFKLGDDIEDELLFRLLDDSGGDALLPSVARHINLFFVGIELDVSLEEKLHTLKVGKLEELLGKAEIDFSRSGGFVAGGCEKVVGQCFLRAYQGRGCQKDREEQKAMSHGKGM